MTLAAYTKTGPFTNGGAPGISATFLNAMETFLTATGAQWDSNASWNGSGVLTSLGQIVNGRIQPNSTGTATAMNTAGNVTLWMPFNGTFKLAMLFFNGARNAGANQDIALPTAFSTFAFFYVGNIINPTTATSSGLNFMLSGVAQNVQEYNGGNVAPATGTNAKAMNIGCVQTGFDTIRILGTANWTATATDAVIIAGV